MSFSKEVKEELNHTNSSLRHCLIVELAVILLYESKIIQNGDGSYEIEIRNESNSIQKYFTLFEKTFNIRAKVIECEQEHILRITKQRELEEILNGTKISFEELTHHRRCIPTILLKNSCCKRAFLKMVYLLIGSISDPEKGYHLEFVCTNERQAEQLKEIMAHYEIEAKSVLRKKYWIVYLKEGASIVELLNIMGAHISLMNLENLRIVKEVRNTVNRRVNCETANISKTVVAASKQIADIQKLIDYKELERLPQNLQEMAQVRMEYPDISLQELGKLLEPSVGKSGVNHRLRRLSERAELLD